MRSPLPLALVVALAALASGCGSKLTCPSGQAVCGGACVDLDRDGDHCGACDTVCGATEACLAGACTVVCDSGEARCGSGAGASCVDLLRDVSNCGGCGVTCPPGPSSTVSCVSGQCRYACAAGFGACDGGAGCGTPLDTTADCGACGVRCGPGGSCVAGACSELLPVVGGFQWQGSQAVKRGATVCSGRIALALGDQAVCFTHADGSLRCAGQIGTSVFGSSFTAVTGMSDVDQVLISGTVNSSTGNDICVHRRDDTAWCMGGLNNNGQLGTGDTSTPGSFVKWGNLDGIARLATGTWDQTCALDTGGAVKCVGYSFGLTPVEPSPGPFQSVWVDTFGTAHLDDGAVLRASAGRAECQVTPTQGLHCPGGTGGGDYGTPGEVVDGATFGPPLMGKTCWLTKAGEVQCTDGQRFKSLPNLAMAANFYSDDLCAVSVDGALWCRGPNAHGELGTGDTQPVTVDRQVQPPGSVRLGCP